MRKAISVVTGVLSLAVAAQASRASDSACEYSVQVSARIQAEPAQITLSWPQDAQVTPKSYTIFRKAPGATSWGAGTKLPGSATNYTDKTVAAGAPYEY